MTRLYFLSFTVRLGTTTSAIGGIIDCKEDIAVDVIGLKGTISPCTQPAQMTVEVYETDIGYVERSAQNASAGHPHTFLFVS